MVAEARSTAPRATPPKPTRPPRPATATRPTGTHRAARIGTPDAAATPPTRPTTSASPADASPSSGPTAAPVGCAAVTDAAVTRPTPRIVAVVVTFNRLDAARSAWSRGWRETAGLDEILVVDNASTDGTGEWLRRPRAGAACTRRTLADNRGGAGGFHDGLALGGRARRRPGLADGRRRPARARLPRRSCSSTTATSTSGARWSSTRPTRTGWSSRSGCPAAPASCTRWPTSSAAAVDGLIRDVVIPFNGVLVTRELVERIGLPREEFFIWGDDHEYLCAPSAAGARIATVVDARGACTRPSATSARRWCSAGRRTTTRPSDLKHYCMARNNLVNLREYRGWPHALAFVAKTAVVLHASPGRDPAPAPAQRSARCAPGCAATSPATGGSCVSRADARDRRRRRRHLQPRRPARPDARRPGRPDPPARRRDRGRQRQHRPHPRGARRATGPAAAARSTRDENLGGAGGFQPGVRGGVRRGASTGSG